VKLEQSFEVGAPIERVWAALIDLEQVAPCLPGAAITGHDEEGTYEGTFQVKLGPTTANYRGTIKIESADESSHTATLSARGSDKRGQGGASATIVNTLHAVDGGTRVDAVTDYTITGRLASFGRGGMIRDISNRLLRDFAACLQSRLEAESTAPAAGDPPAAGTGAAAGTPGEGAAAAGAAATTSAAPAAENGIPDRPAQSTAPPTQPPAAAPPIKGFSLIWGVLLDRIKGLFRRKPA
jgi:carbon monoxide dehydrogenase subunit G